MQDKQRLSFTAEKLAQVPVSNCRFCGTPLTETFVDLGLSPICNDMVYPEKAKEMEPFYPLHTYVCEKCFLVQLEEFVSPENIFDDYTYFSSYSTSWLAHCKQYTEKMIAERGINPESFVVELASNDGYLLQYFKEQNVPVLGIEPARNVAEHAIAEKGIPTEVKFFGVKTAEEVAAKYGKADLILGNNVLAHVPDINDFVGGMKVLLKPGGFITMEFPHLLNLMDYNQFDTIYHEHFSYLSWVAVSRVFEHHGLRLFDVEELPTHGGSLRIYGCHIDDPRPASDAARAMKQRELDAGLETLEAYTDYTEKVKETKRKILEFLIQAKREGKQVVGYGAPGKGNTLLNYCGIMTDFIDYTVDRNPHKQGKLLPGSRIPVYPPEKIMETRPDYVFILPWNLKDEIMEQMKEIRTWGGKFVVPIPEIKVYD